MPKCTKCQWEYPEYLLHQLVDNRKLHGILCPICGLATMNEIHRIPGIPDRKKFDGPRAEQLRQDAIRWRKGHPELAPKEGA